MATLIRSGLAILLLLAAPAAFGDSARRRYDLDPRTLRFLGSYLKPGAQTYRLTFSPDGNSLAAMGGDGIVRLFAARTWEKLRGVAR